MPPPNVTEKLHIVMHLHLHQDILIRYNRVKGLDAKWQPGIDHVGIATQMVTEREMLKQVKKGGFIKAAIYMEQRKVTKRNLANLKY